MRRTTCWSGALIAVTVAVAGCTGDGDGSGGPLANPPTDAGDVTLPAFLDEVPEGMDPAILAPLSALGPCGDTPPAAPTETVAGLVLPPDAIVTRVSSQDPLVNVEGYLPYTPVQTRVFYQEHPALEVLQIEDEVREAESLTTDGTHRLFLKAQAVCEEGSVFVAVVAPEVAGDEVPTPAGTATPP